MSFEKTQLCLFGASPGTGNQGVNALCWSTLENIAARGPVDISVFSYGARKAQGTVPGSSPAVSYRMESISAGRRVWRPNHLRRAEYSAMVGWKNNVIVRAVRNADAVLDASGGDSFTDLYGESRFNDIAGPKKLARAVGSPLILLPQTYGPFADNRTRQIARELIDYATLAYARDADSFDRLQEIMGNRFDPSRHRLGVDVAFGLKARLPRFLESDLQRALLAQRSRPLIGLNVSGLLANRADDSSQRFDLAGDYRQTVTGLLVRLLETTPAHILLVPHVYAPAGHYESDMEASLALVEALPEHLRKKADERISLLRETYDATELKWIIGQTDWFCGSRMHSTIAALSSGVASCALAYSIKTRGVFAACGLDHAVVDLRHYDSNEAIERAMDCWHQRVSSTLTLATILPRVRDKCALQFDDIVSRLQRAKAA